MNVEELLSSKKIVYKKQGQRLVIRCLNPEHPDRNPSMSVDPITGAMMCFSCGFGKGTTLFKHFGISNNERDIRVLKVLKLIDKVRNPDISIPQGTIPFDKDFRGISAKTFLEHKAFTSFTEFKDSVVFPIYSASNKLLSLVSRHIGTEHGTRYVMYPPGVSVPHYPTNPNPYLGSVILVEGIFDYLKLYEAGLTNAIALLGANASNPTTLLSTLALKGVSRVIIMLDADDAGYKASQELLDKLSKKIPNVEVYSVGKFGINDIGSASPSLLGVIRKELYEDSHSTEMPLQETS